MPYQKDCRIQIRLNENGLGSVMIDGQEINDVVDGVMLQTSAGEPNQIFIKLKPVAVAVDGDFNGVVTDGTTFQA